MRILISANALWCRSGYGVQGRHLIPRLQMLGHDVAQFAWYGLEGGVFEFGVEGPDGITRELRCYPKHRDPYGNDVIAAHSHDWQADLVITLIDAWVVRPDLVDLVRPAKLAHWFPIDHAPPCVTITDRLKRADYALPFSRWAVDELARVVTHAEVPTTYMPLGYNPDAYFPGDKAAARRAAGFPEDIYLCTMVAANTSYPARKAFGEQLQAFARFQRRHPEARLYLHTQRWGMIGLDELIAACGIPAATVYWLDDYQAIRGLEEDHMAAIYRASDVLLGASRNEGFGVPLVEAQACGCPVVTTEFSAMPELTVNGLPVAPRQWEWLQGPQVYGWNATPDVEGITHALEILWGRPPDRQRAAAAAGVRHMQEHYTWDVCVRDHWVPWLAQVTRDRLADRGGVLVGIS